MHIPRPLFYKHWSFGKHFAHHEAFYRKGIMGLAYEIVINSSPCISYLMEENTATMQTLVIAHAAFGHRISRCVFEMLEFRDPSSLGDHDLEVFARHNHGAVVSKKFSGWCQS